MIEVVGILAGLYWYNLRFFAELGGIVIELRHGDVPVVYTSAKIH